MAFRSRHGYQLLRDAQQSFLNSPFVDTGSAVFAGLTLELHFLWALLTSPAHSPAPRCSDPLTDVLSRGGSDSPALWTLRRTCLSSVLLSTHFQAHDDSQESLTSLPRRDAMGSYLPDSSSYELLAVIGTSLKTHQGTPERPPKAPQSRWRSIETAPNTSGVPSVF